MRIALKREYRILKESKLQYSKFPVQYSKFFKRFASEKRLPRDIIAKLAAESYLGNYLFKPCLNRLCV
jgi:hypothetical protein